MNPGSDGPRRIPAVAHAAVILFALLFPTVSTWIYFVAAGDKGTAQTAYSAGKLLQFALPVFWIGWAVRAWPRLRAPRLREIGSGVRTGLPIAAVIFLMYAIFPADHALLAAMPAQVRAKLAGFGIDTAWRFVGMGAFYALFHSFMEEYYWRWFVFDQVRIRLGFGAGIAISSLGFMAHHVVLAGELVGGYGAWTWVGSAGVAAGGAIWAWQYDRTRSLYVPWASHLLVDAALMTIGFLLWRPA